MRVGIQAPENYALERLVEIGHERRRRTWRRALPQAKQGLRVGDIHGPPARAQLVEHEPQRVDVAPRRYFAARELFRRHVRRRATHRLRAAQLCGNDGDTEVHDADLTLAVDHDVVRLEIAMDDTSRVRGRQPRGELARDLDRLSTAKRPDPSQQRGEILPGDVLHRQVQAAF